MAVPLSANALTEIPWVRTSEGRMTVRDSLLLAHQIEDLDPGMVGLEYSATFRLLAPILALILRRTDGDVPAKLCTEDVDEVLAELAPSADLYSPASPFMQIATKVKTTGSNVKTGTSLLPFVQGAGENSFWGFDVAPEVASPEDVTLALVVHHHMTSFSNAKLDERSMKNGAPGFVVPGMGLSITEIIATGTNLLQTLTKNIPADWVTGASGAPATGLPAWADRECKNSMLSGGLAKTEAPIWRATWSSNTAACAWTDEGSLVAVEIGGIPDSWAPPTMGASITSKADKDKEVVKAWWDLRNSADHLRLYDAEGKAQRVDLGRHESELLANWHRGNVADLLRQRFIRTVKPRGGYGITFVRHAVYGSTTSPVIRQSVVTPSNPNLWLIDGDAADSAADLGSRLQEVAGMVRAPFSQKGRLRVMKSRREEVESRFWVNADGIFQNYILTDPESEEIPKSVREAVLTAALEAFDSVVDTGAFNQVAPFAAQARNSIRLNAMKALGLEIAKKTAEEKVAA